MVGGPAVTNRLRVGGQWGLRATPPNSTTIQQASDASVPTLDLAAILYGSHAPGDATDRSDVDLAVGFDESLDCNERTRARLDLVVHVGDALARDDVDAVPLAGAPDSLLRDVWADDILLAGMREELVDYGRPSPPMIPTRTAWRRSTTCSPTSGGSSEERRRDARAQLRVNPQRRRQV